MNYRFDDRQLAVFIKSHSPDGRAMVLFGSGHLIGKRAESIRILLAPDGLVTLNIYENEVKLDKDLNSICHSPGKIIPAGVYISNKGFYEVAPETFAFCPRP